jgi:hypothetical protein
MQGKTKGMCPNLVKPTPKGFAQHKNFFLYKQIMWCQKFIHDNNINVNYCKYNWLIVTSDLQIENMAIDIYRNNIGANISKNAMLMDTLWALFFWNVYTNLVCKCQ